LEEIWFFGVKSWSFTRNTPKIYAPPSARRNFFKCTPLTWNPGSAPAIQEEFEDDKKDRQYNDHKNRNEKINTIQQYTTQKTKDWATWTPLKPEE
jgi:hypothetical protein